MNNELYNNHDYLSYVLLLLFVPIRVWSHFSNIDEKSQEENNLQSSSIISTTTNNASKTIQVDSSIFANFYSVYCISSEVEDLLILAWVDRAFNCLL